MGNEETDVCHIFFKEPTPPDDSESDLLPDEESEEVFSCLESFGFRVFLKCFVFS